MSERQMRENSEGLASLNKILPRIKLPKTASEDAGDIY